MKAKIIFMTAWMLWGMNIALAAPGADITEQQRAKQQEMEQQSRVDAPSDLLTMKSRAHGTAAFSVTSGFSHLKLHRKSGKRLPEKVYMAIKH